MASGSRFVRHVKWWFFVLPLLVCVVLPAIPDRALFEISDVESQSVVRALGDDRAAAAVDTTNALFRRLFVDTGAVQATISAGGDDDLDADGMHGFAIAWAKHFWMLVYRALYRAVVMHAWLAGLAVLCLAATADGAVRRKIRAAAAGFASPLKFHLAMHALLLTLGATFTVTLLPVPLIAQCWTAIAVVMPLLLWIVNSSG
ncbi:MAG TPA: DUF4400 domain-containing protein [Paraburkholderia sp.]|uniref:DUF4400 domain-containing protein n=1 Tax=Paraburkholderia sp. TaxID=1926495 RepID=UPI002B462411|nr:DUF4400 domain-containing protein [Paraburkholderia sp.]HKR40052.1 DUF4400 domain-containing protein [Paraburkholderia sp.]